MSDHYQTVLKDGRQKTQPETPQASEITNYYKYPIQLLRGPHGNTGKEKMS